LHNIPSILEFLLIHKYDGEILITTSQYGDDLINDNATYVGCTRNNSLHPFQNCYSKFSQFDIQFFDLEVFVEYRRSCRYPDCDSTRLDQSNHMCVPGSPYDAAKTILQQLIDHKIK
jgi:hypothetical protein